MGVLDIFFPPTEDDNDDEDNYEVSNDVVETEEGDNK